MHSMRRFLKTFWLFAAILIVAAFFRFWKIESIPPGLYPDEAMNGNNALYTLKTGDFRVFYPENNGREGLFINIVAIWLKIFGNFPWTIRLVSALFGFLTVAGVFYLARELFREKLPPEDSDAAMNFKKSDIIALSAAFFMAVSFWHVNFSRIGFRAIMAPFFLIWSIYFLWLIFRPQLSNKTKILSAVAGGLFFGLGFHSYIAYRIAPLVLIAPAIKIKKEGGLKFMACFAVAAALAISPLAIYFWKNPSDFFGRTNQISVLATETPAKNFIVNLGKTFGAFWIGGDQNARHNLPGSAMLWLPVGILFAIGLANSLFSLFRKTAAKSEFKTAYLFLWTWLIIFSLPVAFSSESLPHALRSILMLPAVIIFSAYGFWLIVNALISWFKETADLFPERFKEIRRIKFEFLLLTAVFLAAHIFITYSNYFIIWAKLPETNFAFSVPYAEMAKWLNAQTKELPKFVIVNADGVLIASPDDKKTRPLPTPSQTIMFLTDSWPVQNQKNKNINYVLPSELAAIDCRSACAIIMLEPDSSLKNKLKENIDGLRLSAKPGFTAYYKNAI